MHYMSYLLYSVSHFFFLFFIFWLLVQWVLQWPLLAWYRHNKEEQPRDDPQGNIGAIHCDSRFLYSELQAADVVAYRISHTRAAKEDIVSATFWYLDWILYTFSTKLAKKSAHLPFGLLGNRMCLRLCVLVHGNNPILVKDWIRC